MSHLDLQHYPVHIFAEFDWINEVCLSLASVIVGNATVHVSLMDLERMFTVGIR